MPSHIKKVSDVTFAGTAVNNPVPLTIDNYNLSAAELKLAYRQFNLITYHDEIGVNLQVTGLVQIDPYTGQPMLDDNDPVRLPCPPFCYL